MRLPSRSKRVRRPVRLVFHTYQWRTAWVTIPTPKGAARFPVEGQPKPDFTVHTCEQNTMTVAGVEPASTLRLVLAFRASALSTLACTVVEKLEEQVLKPDMPFGYAASSNSAIPPLVEAPGFEPMDELSLSVFYR